MQNILDIHEVNLVQNYIQGKNKCLSITSVKLKNIFVRAQNVLDIDEVTLVQIFYI